MSFSSILWQQHSIEKSEFITIQELVKNFCEYLLSHKDEVVELLTEYETYEVAMDEVYRTIDLFSNLDQNKQYFGFRTDLVKCFLPQNQPLYALCCFAIVPSFQAKEVQIRPPQSAHRIFEKLVEILNVSKFFPNIDVFYEDKHQFAKRDSKKTNVVIFTGTSEVGLNLRKQYPLDCLFLLNGSGHNPIVVTESASIYEAVKNTLKVCLFNQGQDCSAPSSILVHSKVYDVFKEQLLKELNSIKSRVGSYKVKSNIVGPNTSGKHVVRIAEVFRKNKKFFLWGGNINPISQIIDPTVFEKPLELGANYEEFFAPIIMLQRYENDQSLKNYFDQPRYYHNAMYVTVFGFSEFVESLKQRGLHTSDNIIYNTNIQEIERGFLEYGGLGPRASCIYHRGNKYLGATLPQRDIYNFLLKKEFHDG